MIRMRGIFQKDLKNRSSKNLYMLTGVGHKPAVMSVSNKTLEAWNTAAEGKNAEITKEINRRAKKRDKKSATA